MSINSGRFETSTKVKISTPNGNVLKVTHYPIDEEPFDDYRIRPKCEFCGGDVGCVCYSEGEYDNSLSEATDGLLRDWCCEKIDCLYKALEKYNPDKLTSLKLTYGDDKWSIVDAMMEDFPEDDYGIFCEV